MNHEKEKDKMINSKHSCHEISQNRSLAQNFSSVGTMDLRDIQIKIEKEKPSSFK